MTPIFLTLSLLCGPALASIGEVGERIFCLLVDLPVAGALIWHGAHAAIMPTRGGEPLPPEGAHRRLLDLLPPKLGMILDIGAGWKVHPRSLSVLGPALWRPRKPSRRPAAWSRGRRKPGTAQTLLGRSRRWIGMLMRTMVPILSVFLLLAAALTFGNLSGTGATPDPAVGTHDGTITGRASVVDGDTIEIHGQRIRLSGIDAPESGQLCFNANDKPWRCGQQAALALADRIGRAPVTCRRTDTDHYGRTVAVCFKGEQDLNAWMVAQGWAVAYRRYSRAYVAHENQAKAAGAGIWPSRFVMPWDWRRGHRVARHDEANARPDGCVIKGNINQQGKKIYHVPGGRWYVQTGINESQGERWFCSEAEARAAGWRKAQQ